MMKDLIENNLYDDDISEYNLKDVKQLYLNCNNLTLSTPPNIPNVVNLYLCYNNISVFPTELCKLKNLRYISLTHNKLSSLPPEFSQLKLKKLSLSYNLFTSIPNEVLKMPLKMLLMHDNKINEIPRKFNKNLIELDLINNNISQIPPLARNKNLILALGQNNLNIAFMLNYTQFARNMHIYINYTFTRVIMNSFFQPIQELI